MQQTHPLVPLFQRARYRIRVEPRSLFVFGGGLEDISSRIVRKDKEFLSMKDRRIVALVVTVHAQPERLQRYLDRALQDWMCMLIKVGITEIRNLRRFAR